MGSQTRQPPVRQPALETKDFPFQVKADDVTPEGVFEGYASTFGNVDAQDDVVEPGAFKKTLREQRSWKLLWAHDAYELPLGVVTDAREDDRGLWVKGELNLDDDRARRVHSLMLKGVIDAMSIGYKTVRQSFVGSTRKLLEVKLREVSLVNFPANELALVTRVKSEVLSASDIRRLDGLGATPILINALRLADVAAKDGHSLTAADLELAAATATALKALLDGAADQHAAPGIEPTLRAVLKEMRTMTEVKT